MNNLKDYLRDFQQKTIDIRNVYCESPTMNIKEYQEQLEDSLEMAIEIIIKNLIGGEL
jgi:hypothetical protein